MTPTYRILMDKVLIPLGSHAQPLRAQLFFSVGQTGRDLEEVLVSLSSASDWGRWSGSGQWEVFSVPLHTPALGAGRTLLYVSLYLVPMTTLVTETQGILWVGHCVCSPGLWDI